MAVTCSWEKPLGICYDKRDTEKKYPLIIWGGGNCLAVITNQPRQLFAFFCDKAHMKRCKDFLLAGDFHSWEISMERPTDAKQITDILFQLRIEYKVIKAVDHSIYEWRNEYEEII